MQSAQAGPVEVDRPGTLPYPPSMERAVGPQPAQQPPEPYAELAAVCPIGAFDSGLGGLSIIRDLRRLLPHEEIVYYGDNANCPYGGRSEEHTSELQSRFGSRMPS